MRWIEATPEQRDYIVGLAATMLVADGDEALEEEAGRRITVADLADYARGRPLRKSEAALRLILMRHAAMRGAFSQLLARFGGVTLPFPVAAADVAPARRQDTATGTEVAWLQSSADENTVFVRISAPATMRPLSTLTLFGTDGQVAIIRIDDDGGDVEVLLERNSPEFSLLSDQDAEFFLR